MYLGDFALGSTIDVHFTSRQFTTGAPFALAGSPAVAAYPNNSTTQLTAGITLTTNFDGVTGLNHVRIVATSGNGYAAGSTYSLVLTAGTVDSVSVVAEVIAMFSLEARVVDVAGSIGSLAPQAQADVKAQVDQGLVDARLDELLVVAYAGSPAAGSLIADLTEDDGGTARFTANALEQAPTGGTNPNVLADTTIATVNSQTSFTLTAGSDVDDAYTSQAIVLYDASNSDFPSVRVVTDYVGSTRTVTLDQAPDFTIVAGDGVRIFVTAPGTTAPTAGEVADAVWDEALSGHVSVGSSGERLGRLPNAAAGGNGGLPTVDANNYVAGIQGTLNQLDDLNDLSAAEVNAEADQALADYDGPTYTEVLNLFRVALRADTALATDLAALVTSLNADLGSGVGAYDNTTDAQEQLGTNTGQSLQLPELLDNVIGPQVTVVADGSNTATSFEIDSTVADTDHWEHAWLSFDLTTTTAALRGQVRQITGFNPTTNFVTVADAFTQIPQAGDTARLVTR